VNPTEPNPLAILSFFVAPAILTNASSVLTLATSNRFARAMDRTRVLIGELSSPESPTHARRVRELLHAARRRSALLVRALNAYYMAVASFGFASLSALFGALFLLTGLASPRRVAFVAAFCGGAVGVASVIYASAISFVESRIAIRIVTVEADAALEENAD
jgi:hypothetical protein